MNQFLGLLLAFSFSVSTSVQAEQATDSSSVLDALLKQLPGVVKQMQQHKKSTEQAMGQFAVEKAVDGHKQEPEIKKKQVMTLNRSIRRDPFAVSQLMIEQTHLQERGLRFTPLAGAQVPELKLRGVVNGTDGQRVGLIEVINEGVFLVRKGDTISLRTAGNNTVINIQEISQLSVVVESGTLGEVIIVR